MYPNLYQNTGVVAKVRLMEIGRAYKARYIRVPRKYDEAKLFVYVINKDYLIAYRDPQLVHEIGMLQIRDFEIFGHLNLVDVPVYKSVCPIKLTYGKLLNKIVKVEEIEQNLEQNYEKENHYRTTESKQLTLF